MTAAMSRKNNPPKLFNFKEWLTLEDAARHLSLLFDEEVSVADVLRLALDKRLVLSVWFVNHTRARKGHLVPLSECRMLLLPGLAGMNKKIPLPDQRVFTQAELATIYPTIQEHIEAGVVIVTPDALNYDDDQWLVQEESVVSIDGVWDLPMVGAETLDVEHRFQMETGGPEITLVHMEGPLVCREGVFCQLMDDFEDNEFSSGSKASLKLIKKRIQESELDKKAADALMENYRIQREKFLELRNKTNPSNNYFPAGGMPQDAVWVVRTSALRDFERSVRATSDDTEKPLSKREETTLLNITGALLSLLLGKTPSGKAFSVFQDQTAVIDALLAAHEGKPGIAKRTMEEKFSAAKRSLSSS